jgi:ABC-type transporter Mla MlaB component
MTANRGPTLVVRGPIAPHDIPVLCRRARALLQDGDGELVVCDVGGLLDPDATTVEALARLQLTARRLGCRVQLRHSCRELRELVAFIGLDEILR